MHDGLLIGRARVSPVMSKEISGALIKIEIALVIVPGYTEAASVGLSLECFFHFDLLTDHLYQRFF